MSKTGFSLCDLCYNQRATDTVMWQIAQIHVGHPFERIAMDLAGQFLMSQRDNRRILVVADYFREWCKAYPVPTIDAPEIAEA